MIVTLWARMFAVTVGVVVAGAVSTAPTVQASNVAAVTADGDLQIVPGFSVLHIAAIASTSTGGPTIGTYTATVKVGATALPVQVSGPITCLQTTPTTASFIYPIDATTPDILPPALRGQAAVQITLRTGRSGQPAHAGVFGPLPARSLTGCAPQPTPFPYRGALAITTPTR